MSELYLGIDMGGTLIKMAVVDSKANVVEETSVYTDIKASPKTVIKNIADIFKKFKNYDKVKSIGVGIAGDVDYKKGLVRFSPNLPKWKNIQLKKELEKLTKKTVYVDNDANTASIGAFWLDIKNKADNMVCVTLGTGVGGGIIIDGKLLKGKSGGAGEMHFKMYNDKRNYGWHQEG